MEMVKIDFSELSAVANSINGAVMSMSDSFESVKSGANDLVHTSSLDSPAWSNTKNYFQTYPVLGDGIWNSAMTVSETLTSYLSAFQSEVGSPKNQLDSDKLQEMQDKLTGIQTSRKNLLESMSKAEDYVLSNLSNRLSGLDSSAEYFTKEIEILTKYIAFEAAHSGDFNDIQSTIGELKIGMTQISQSKNFHPIKGYARLNYNKMDWYNKVSVFNSEQPEVRMVKFTHDGIEPFPQYKIYNNGVLNQEATDKFNKIMMEKDLEFLIDFVGEVSGVYDGVRFFIGIDPITGEKVTLEEWMKAGFWTALELLSAAKMIDILKNIKLNKKLLSGVSLTEDELRLFSKMGDLGDYKIIEKADDMVPRNLNKGSQSQIIKQIEDGSLSLTEKGNTVRKSNYGEMKMDQVMAEKGYNRISIDTVKEIDNPIRKGIDGVYYNPDGHPPYIIGEAKFGTSTLDKLKNGTKQMSDGWILQDDRLIKAVGKDVYDDILLEGYDRVLIEKINPDGSYVTAYVDEFGNKIKK
ncbi:pre-toxin TG domain-containing protein [Enterococcus sp. BWR-S5]|uniref:pre-toxin TG domain-containing protein n=1 Tax=Enterococcus sp. BWR-S5 TaxID=2787714 RepID=UPI00192063C7|nr:pre-toxin TG domain-containing protein [Enterococcus sp. BWR-S5]MBL1225128.1 hypothetical protein [Enterococcus sp. BWR-S5]